MKQTFYQKHKKVFDLLGGLLLANPVLERGLVLAPVIVASYNAKHSFILGFSFLLITFISVFVSSFIPKKIPYTIRTILYTLIASGVFIPVAMWMDRLFPQTLFKIGVFLPLLVANSLIVVKSESRFHKRRMGIMLIDLLCHCLGFFLVILVVGMIREFIGSGTLFGVQLQTGFTIPAVLMPFSGFILVGFLAALVKKLKYKLEHPRPRKKNMRVASVSVIEPETTDNVPFSSVTKEI